MNNVLFCHLFVENTPLPVFAKKHGHFEQELSIRLVSTIDGNS
jgi:hypothetical protein